MDERSEGVGIFYFQGSVVFHYAEKNMRAFEGIWGKEVKEKFWKIGLFFFWGHILFYGRDGYV